MQHSYHSGTIKSLYAHLGNCCAFPSCGQELVTQKGMVLDAIYIEQNSL